MLHMSIYVIRLVAHLARLTVALDGPLMIRFLKPPVSVRLPLPRETVTLGISSGSKCSIPNSGIPTINFKLERISKSSNDYKSSINDGLLPLANIGNIPSNIFRKHPFSFGLSRLQVSSQSAGIERK